MTDYRVDTTDGKLRCVACDTTLVEVRTDTVDCSKCGQTLFGGHNIDVDTR